MQYEDIGGYYYEYGYCVYFAAARALGNGHPAIAELHKGIEVQDIVSWAARWGFPYCFGAGQRMDVSDDAAVMYIVKQHGGNGYHAFSTRDWRKANQREICGIVVLS